MCTLGFHPTAIITKCETTAPCSAVVSHFKYFTNYPLDNLFKRLLAVFDRQSFVVFGYLAA